MYIITDSPIKEVIFIHFLYITRLEIHVVILVEKARYFQNAQAINDASIIKS